MGAYASNFQNDSGSIVAELTDPSKVDWITAHATATGLTVVEVERLWQRFQQLQCTKEGILTPDILDRPPASDDIFVRNILGNMRSEDNNVTFQTFLAAMKWAENSSLDEKIRGIFHLVNSGDPITKDILQKVLSQVYPEDSTETVKRITDVFFQQIDTVNQGYIDEDQLCSWVKTLPAETVSKILEFHIIPPEVAAEALKDSKPRDNMPSVDTVGHQVPTDGVLRQVSDKIARRDWHLVANKLGYTGDDIKIFERENSGNAVDQVYATLRSWRDRDGANAYVETLEHALRDSNMNDVALILYP